LNAAAITAHGNAALAGAVGAGPADAQPAEDHGSMHAVAGVEAVLASQGARAAMEAAAPDRDADLIEVAAATTLMPCQEPIHTGKSGVAGSGSDRRAGQGRGDRR